MKQRIQNGIAVLLLLIGLTGLLEFFSVGGIEIAGVLRIAQADRVTVECYQLHQYDDRTVCTLDKSQKQQLQQLLVDTRFRRSPADFVRFYDRQMYEIQIQFSEQEPPLSLHLIGGEWLSVTNQFDGHHLKICSEDWEQRLDAIFNR